MTRGKLLALAGTALGLLWVGGHLIPPLATWLLPMMWALSTVVVIVLGRALRKDASFARTISTGTPSNGTLITSFMTTFTLLSVVEVGAMFKLPHWPFSWPLILVLVITGTMLLLRLAGNPAWRQFLDE
ncbi:MAG: hypothetical protein JNL05_09160 [Flavobacteriales bacterium]|nr:hypothetical protein [Flavobacteriales bacterium]